MNAMTNIPVAEDFNDRAATLEQLADRALLADQIKRANQTADDYASFRLDCLADEAACDFRVALYARTFGKAKWEALLMAGIVG